MSDDARALLRDYLAEVRAGDYLREPATFVSGRAILESSPETHVDVLMASLGDLWDWNERQGAYQGEHRVLERLTASLINRPLPLTGEQVTQLLARIRSAVEKGPDNTLVRGYLGDSILWNLFAWLHDHEVSPEARAHLEDIHRRVAPATESPDTRRLMARIGELLIGERASRSSRRSPGGRMQPRN